MPTATCCDLSPGDNLPGEEEETSLSCWGGFCRKGPRKSVAEKALLKAQFKLYKTQVRVHQSIQQLWRDAAAVAATKELKEEEEKKKEWSAGAGDHKKTAMDWDAPVALVDESMATSLTLSNITIHLAGTGSGNSSDGSSGYPSQSESSKCLADSSVIDSSDDGSLHSDPCTPLPLQLVNIYL
ncbi:unnamed protein product [Lampetra planeri]